MVSTYSAYIKLHITNASLLFVILFMPSDGILHDLPRYGLDLFTDEAKVVKADDSLTAQHVDWEPHWSELLPIFFEIVDVRDVWTAQETKSPIFVCVDSVELQISQAQSLIAT